MVSTNQQRIFHYGRELKTLGRTLQALGVGRFTNTTDKKAGPKIVLHLHAIPYSAAMLSSDKSDIKPTVATLPSINDHRYTASTRPQTTRAATRATTTSASTSNMLPATTTSTSSMTTNQLLPPPAAEVVDLYSDDDENDDVVIVVNNKPTTASTATTTTTTSTTNNNHSNKRRRI